MCGRSGYLPFNRKTGGSLPAHLSSYHPPIALTHIEPLGLKVLYGGEHAYSCSLQMLGGKGTILNL